MRFSGRTAVVTGGAGGIGRAVCAGFAAGGAAVAVVDVDEHAVEEATRALRLNHRTNGADLRGYPLDVTDPEAVRMTMARIHEEHDGLDVLVCLAGGHLNTPRDLNDINPEHVDHVLDVNVKGTLYCCQAAVPLMTDTGGAIVTCSSIGARQPTSIIGVPYAAAKAAILGLTRRLARELGPIGIRVNAIAPGMVLTARLHAMYETLTDVERREILAGIPLGRMPDLREIVDPILFLAGEESSYVTGAVLDVNGGRYMSP